jgi:hypothetical protein
MAATQEKVYKIDIEDKPGALYELLAASAEAGVNISFLAAFSAGGGKGAAFIIAEKPEAIMYALKLKKKEPAVEEYTGFLLRGDDRIGAGANLTKPLADGGINILLSAATIAAGEYQLLILVDPADAAEAAKLLGS